MAANSTITAIIESLADAIQPLQIALTSPELFEWFMLRLGWVTKQEIASIKNLGGTITNLLNLTEGGLTTENVPQAISLLAGFFQAVKNLGSAGLPPTIDAAEFAADFSQQLTDFLIADYLLNYRPLLGALLLAGGVITRAQKPAQGKRVAYERLDIAWSAAGDLLKDTLSTLRSAYGWGTDQFAQQAFIDNMVTLGEAFGYDIISPTINKPLADQLNQGATPPTIFHDTSLRWRVFGNQVSPAPIELGVDLFVLPQTGVLKPGVGISPYLKGLSDETIDVSDTSSLIFKSDFDLSKGLLAGIRPGQGLTLSSDLFSSNPGSGGNFSITLQTASTDGSKTLLLGAEDGSRFEYGSLDISLGTHVDHDGASIYAQADIKEGNLVISPGEDADSFIATFLPSGFSSAASPSIVVDSRRGTHFGGSSNFDLSIPVHISTGPLEIESISFSVKGNNAALPIQLLSTVNGSAGPLEVEISDIGMTVDLSFPGSGGNIGPVNAALKFKPPEGVGLSIDGEGLSGGGFLRYSDADQSYAGVLELVYEDRISLKAIGLITTRLPGGESGYSLLILITAEFAPIQLGLGFTLNGVGGLLGYNRSAAVERLRSGLRDGTLSSILFPQDVIANAPRILSDLRQVFPPTAGHFIFGPMARLAWGTPPLLTIDLGLILELPNPLRMIILGVLRMALPTDDEVLLLLQVNFLGVIDFNAGTLAFDAHLFDSRLLGLTLDGDMAVRARWFGEKNLLLSVGGFHPLYQPPPLDLPKLSRITVNLLSGDDPRITLETYYAITSNTYQFGAKIELYASAGPFAVHGLLAYDVLFQRSPFHFSADAKAKLDLLAGSSVIAGIDLSLTLEGPTPYHAHGTAHLEICWFLEISVHFDHTWGEDRDTTLPSVAVLPRLHDALADPTNWQTALPPGKNLLVTYRKIDPPPGLLLIAPAGILTISQKVVPLDVPIQIFNDQSPADATLFSIEQVTSGPATLNKTATPEDFAPAQFFERSDTDKLTGKSFEQYDGGVRIDDTGELQAEYAAARDVTYQVFYKDPQRPQPVQTPGKERLQLEAAVFETFAVGGAVARSPLSHARRAQPAGLPGAVAVAQEQFTVVSSMDLSPLQDGQVFPSEAEALVHLHQLLRQQPSLEGEVQVIPAYEMSPA